MRLEPFVFFAFAAVAGARDIPLPQPATQATQSAPAAAFNGSTVLVAWTETGVDAMGRIVAARLASDGTLLDAQGIQIAPGVKPSVATDGHDFLVVFRDDELVRAAVVRADGTVGTAFRVSTEGGESSPHVTFDAANYFVVWDNGEGNENRHMDAARVTRTGQLVDTFPMEFGSGADPAVAFDGTNNWLVYALSGKLFARRISPDGINVGDSVVLDPSAANPSPPAIACASGTCLAAWTNRSLFATILNANGSAGLPLPIVPANEQSPPAIAADENGFFITWPQGNGSDFDSWAARISRSGELRGFLAVATTGLDESSAFPILLSGTPAVVYSRNGTGADFFTYRLFLRTNIPESRRRAGRR